MDDTKAPKAKKKTANPLVAAAQAIGSAAGSVASTLGVHEEATPPAPPVKAPAKAVGKLPKKDKSRLPRRQKKALRRKEQMAK